VGTPDAIAEFTKKGDAVTSTNNATTIVLIRFTGLLRLPMSIMVSSQLEHIFSALRVFLSGMYNL
jgi:hypothetical protein